MAPSLSIFSRRKNSDGDRTATPKSPERSTLKSPTPSLPAPPTVTTTRFRSRSNDSPGPASPKHLPRLQTSPTAQEPAVSLRRTPSSASTSSRQGHQRCVSSQSNYVPFPPSPLMGRQIYQPAPLRTQRFQHYSHNDNMSLPMLPTPVETPVTPAGATPTSARPGENVRKRAFRFPPTNTLPISPPLSPETPMEAGNNSLGMSPVFPMRNHANTPSMDSNDSRNESLLQRIRELEHELETERSHHSTRITALRQSHVDVVASLKESQAADMAALRQSTAPGWSLLAIEGKEKELEILRANTDVLNLRLEDMEELLQERDRQLERTKEKLRSGGESADTDKVLVEDIRLVVQEEKRGSGLAEKLDAIEAQRNIERMEYESRLDTMRGEKEALEAKLRQANDELERWRAAPPPPPPPPPKATSDDPVSMVRTLAARLTEEKKKNQGLEASMAQITEDAWCSVADSKHEIQKLKNAAEDRDAHIASLNRESAIVRRERAQFEEAWKTLCKENATLQQTVDDRSERIKDLEEESGALRDTLQRTRAQLLSIQQQQQQQSDVHGDILVKLDESSCSSSRSNSPPAADDGAAATTTATTTTTDFPAIVAQLQRDAKGYRSDIRAYRRDVKLRDRTICQLQSQLSATPNLTLLEEFPLPRTDTAQLKDENAMLRAQLANRDALARQHNVVLRDLEEKVKRLRREKELFELESLQHFRRMRQKFVLLEQRAAEVAEVRLGNIPEPGWGWHRNGSGKCGNGGVGMGIDLGELPPPPPPKSPGGPMTPGREEEKGEVFVW